MATVYLATHVALNATVAIKVLHVTAASVQKRLLVEGRVQASLKHPNVVAVTDVIEVSGSPGLVMDYIAGPCLHDVLENVRLDEAQIDHLARGLLAGMGAAHAQDLIHRDLKPGNILIDPAGGTPAAKITDFGLAKVLHTGMGTNTRSGIAMGTPHYMAPEQFVDAKSVDTTADVYSMGVILYEMMAGHRGLEGSNPGEVYAAAITGRRTPIREAAPDMPEAWLATVERALERAAQDRFGTAAEMLESWAADRVAAIPEYWPPLLLSPPESHAAVVSADRDKSFDTWMAADEPPVSAKPTSEQPASVPPPKPRTPLLLPVVAVAVMAATLVGAVMWSAASETSTLGSGIEIVGGGYATVYDTHPTDELVLRQVSRSGQVQEIWFETPRGHPVPRAGQEPKTALNKRFPPPFEVSDHFRLIGLRNVWNPSGSRVDRVEWIDPSGEVSIVERWTEEGDGTLLRTWHTPGGMRVAGVAVESRRVFASRRSRLDERGRETWFVREDTGHEMDTYATRVMWTDDDLVLTRTFEDLDGNEKLVNGIAVEHRRYDPNWPRMWGGAKYTTFGGGLAVGGSGCAIQTWDYTANGGITSCLNAAREPAAVCAQTEVVVSGDVTTHACQDANGHSVRGSDGHATVEVTFDARGHRLQERTLDVDGSLVPRPTGVANVQTRSDERGFIVQVGPNLSVSGKPLFDPVIGYGEKRDYDDRGRLITTSRLGPDGTPKAGVKGWVLERRAYDEHGRVASISYFDDAVRPALANGMRHVERFTYDDDQWFPTRSAWFDTLDRPSTDESGVHRRDWAWHEDLTYARVAVFDVDGSPMLMSVGTWWGEVHCHGFEEVYDGPNGKNTCIGVDGKPLQNEQGWAWATMRQQLSGSDEETHLWAADGTPAKTTLWTRRVARFDNDQLKQFEYFDGDDRPISTRCATVAVDHDDAGHAIRIRCLNRDGDPYEGMNQCAVVEYDFIGDLESGMRCLDRNGELTPHRVGFKAERKQYDERNFLKSEDWILADGTEHSQVYVKDDYGRTLSVEGTSHEKPAAMWMWENPGVQRAERVYDDRGNQTVLRQFGVHGDLPGAVPPVTRSTFDDRGLEITSAYVTHDGEPYTTDARPAVLHSHFDTRRRLIGATAEDGKGAAVTYKGCWEIRLGYPDARTDTYQCLDRAGRPMLGEDDLYETRTTRDSRGNKVSVVGFDADGRPAVMPPGAHEIRWKYNQINRRTRQAWYGVDGELVATEERPWAVHDTEWDHYAHRVADAYSGPDGAPIAGPEGCAVVRYDVATNGRIRGRSCDAE